MNVQLLTYTPEPEKLITTAAKLCYSKTDACGIYEKLTEENVDKFIKMLADLGHESPLEHASFTFAIDGVSRSLLAQSHSSPHCFVQCTEPEVCEPWRHF